MKLLRRLLKAQLEVSTSLLHLLPSASLVGCDSDDWHSSSHFGP